MADEILTIREVAELLKINEKTAYRLAADLRATRNRKLDKAQK